jgi:subfamily B ATP-binding cassette protein MsbA
MHNFTTIVIAHRLSTIQKMDWIIVLEKGRIVEVGTFKELLSLNGRFAKMWKQQKL